MKKLALMGLFTATTALAPASQAALVAQWTFNSGTASNLTANVGGYVFAESSPGSGNTTTHNADGTISLGRGRLLTATGLNSTALPQLTSAVTLWMRVKLESLPNAPANFHPFAGLTQNVTPPTSGFTGQALSAATNTVTSGVANLTFTSITSSGQVISPASGYPTAAVDTYKEIAVVYQGGTNSTITLYSDGASVARTGTGTNLASFLNLSLGRLQSGTSITLNFDEFRVYDEALTALQISNLDPVPVPEPSALALLTTGGFMLLARRRQLTTR